MKTLFKYLISTLKAYQDYETRISMLKAITVKAKTRRVRITDDQIELLITCGILGIKDGNQIQEIAGIKIPEPDK